MRRRVRLSVIEMDRQQIDHHFERLNEALKGCALPTEHEGERECVSAEEFMLMRITEDGCVRFKHIVTRNYIILLPDGYLAIPTGQPFALGFFDSSLGGTS